jgi:hypothetical protein
MSIDHSILSRNSARSRSIPMGPIRSIQPLESIQPQSSYGGILIVILFLLRLLDIDQLALVEYHAVGIIAAAVEVHCCVRSSSDCISHYCAYI